MIKSLQKRLHLLQCSGRFWLPKVQDISEMIFTQMVAKLDAPTYAWWSSYANWNYIQNNKGDVAAATGIEGVEADDV